MADLEERLLAVIKALRETVWPRNVTNASIDDWLDGFGAEAAEGTDGRTHMLYLLSKFLYFGDFEIRAMIRALFRDHFQYPTVAATRRALGNTTDLGVLSAAVQRALQITRFIGMGRPSESGTHLLYFYRQVNSLPIKCFMTTDEILEIKGGAAHLANEKIRRYVYLDDLCGSGEQAIKYSTKWAEPIRAAAANTGKKVSIDYHVLIATSKALNSVRINGKFDEVRCVLELDDSYKVFSPNSRYFRYPPNTIDAATAEHLASYYGERLFPGHPLGYKESELMLGFAHNTPDNTLPIFWKEGSSSTPWSPIFPRYPKFDIGT